MPANEKIMQENDEKWNGIHMENSESARIFIVFILHDDDGTLPPLRRHITHTHIWDAEMNLISCVRCAVLPRPGRIFNAIINYHIARYTLLDVPFQYNFNLGWKHAASHTQWTVRGRFFSPFLLSHLLVNFVFSVCSKNKCRRNDARNGKFNANNGEL